jgi:hypothetical protein
VDTAAEAGVVIVDVMIQQLQVNMAAAQSTCRRDVRNWSQFQTAVSWSIQVKVFTVVLDNRSGVDVYISAARQVKFK